MNEQGVSFAKSGRLATITFAWPIQKDIPFLQLYRQLEDIRNTICHDNDISVVIITGQQIFPANSNTDGLSSLKIEEKYLLPLSLSSIIDTIDRPVIVAIEGDASGQGLELALACDLRICSEGAQFGIPNVTFGEIPWGGATQRLPRLVGKGKAMEMILTGEMIDAQEAYRIGLVNKVVSPKELFGAVMDIAQEMTSKGPIALCYAKEAVNQGMDLSLLQGLRLEADLYFLMHTTEDRTEGIRAFQENRKAQFKGK